MSIKSSKTNLIPVPSGNAHPFGIIVTPDGTPWIPLLGTDNLASIDPQSLIIIGHRIATGERPRRLDADSGERIYYSDYRHGFWAASIPRPAKQTNGSCR